MTTTKAAIDLLINANLVMGLAWLAWAAMHQVVRRTRLRLDFAAQLRVLRLALFAVLAGPLLAVAAGPVVDWLAPSAPLTIGDIAVAAYLRGDISMSAARFEELLMFKQRSVDAMVSGRAPWLVAVAVLLAAGALVCIGRTALSLIRLNRVLSRSHVWRRTGSVDLRFSDAVDIPFAARGLRRRHVVLPIALLTRPRELRVVLAHEFEHLRQGDVEWEILLDLLRPALYWNPAFHLWKRAFDRLREVNCDQAVLERAAISPRDYARCLLAFCAVAGSGRQRQLPGMALMPVRASRARRAIETRILALADRRRQMAGSLLVWTVSALVVLSITLVSTSFRKSEDWSQDRLLFSSVVNLERHYAKTAAPAQPLPGQLPVQPSPFDQSAWN